MSCSLHDLMNLDGRGLPGVTVVTDAFAGALASQASALGFEPAVVFVPHPIQNRTADELRQVADDACEPIVRALTAG